MWDRWFSLHTMAVQVGAADEEVSTGSEYGCVRPAKADPKHKWVVNFSFVEPVLCIIIGTMWVFRVSEQHMLLHDLDMIV